MSTQDEVRALWVSTRERIASFHEESGGYRLVDADSKRLSNSEILAVCKILLDSRSLRKDEMISGQWDSVWLQPSVRGKNLKYLSPDQRGEGYALLWRKNKFEIPPPVKDSKTGIEEDQGPIIFSGYHAAKDGLRLIRDPLYARLILKEKKAVELRILITHVIYGKPSMASCFIPKKVM